MVNGALSLIICCIVHYYFWLKCLDISGICCICYMSNQQAGFPWLKSKGMTTIKLINLYLEFETFVTFYIVYRC